MRDIYASTSEFLGWLSEAGVEEIVDTLTGPDHQYGWAKIEGKFTSKDVCLYNKYIQPSKLDYLYFYVDGNYGDFSSGEIVTGTIDLEGNTTIKSIDGLRINYGIHIDQLVVEESLWYVLEQIDWLKPYDFVVSFVEPGFNAEGIETVTVFSTTGRRLEVPTSKLLCAEI